MGSSARSVSHCGDLARGVHSRATMQRRSAPSQARGFTLTEAHDRACHHRDPGDARGLRRAPLRARFRKRPNPSKSSTPFAPLRNRTRTKRSRTSAPRRISRPTTPARRTTASARGYGPGVDTWNQLGVRVSAPVQFGYACVAGTATNALPALDTAGDLNYPADPTAPWYVVKAAGDRDEDDVLAMLHRIEFYRRNLCRKR